MLQEKILIVDDETLLSDLLFEALQTQGYTNLEKASNGLEGLEKYKKFHPDLVLMDIEMPVMDGYESSSKIKSFDPDARILVITANPRDTKARKTVEEGIALTLLSKPLKLTKLFQTIEQNLMQNLPDESNGLTSRGVVSP